MQRFGVCLATRGRLSFWLLVCLLGWLPPCRSQDELRRLGPRYPASFILAEVRGGHASYGRSQALAERKMFYPLAQLDGKLFVGARDELFSLDSVTFQLNQSVDIPSSGQAGNCGDYCFNFVRLVEPLSGGDLLVCSTNRARPYCQTRFPANLSASSDIQQYSGFNTLPFEPHQNFTWLLSGDTVFAGGYLARASGGFGDAVFSRSRLTTGNSVRITLDIRTKTSAGTVLNGDSVHFVGDPIEYNGRVYFFFREVATEETQDTVVHSRVGMVCKNDTGGKEAFHYTPSHAVTFAKARLRCAIEGEPRPYVYREIRDTYRSTESNKVVFALFATPSPGVTSSAVCAFRLDHIESLFIRGKFYAQTSPSQPWTVLATDPVTPRQTTCPDTASYDNQEYIRLLGEGQLMHRRVEDGLFYEGERAEAGSRHPLLVSDGERFSRFAVNEDVVDALDVMFIGTEKGTILKVYLNAARSQAKVVEEIRLESNIQTPVLSMLKSEDGQAVFVSTSHGVYRVPVQHCLDYPTRQECLDIRDPYCSWNTTHCVHSNGEQDLDNGSGPESPGTVTIRHSPRSHQRSLRIPNQPVHLYLTAASTPPGRNPRVRGGQIRCDPCASLPYAAATFSTPAEDFLALYINGSSPPETEGDCSCSCIVEIDSGETAVASFNLTVDNSVPRSEAIVQYQTKLKNWVDELTACREPDGVLIRW